MCCRSPVAALVSYPRHGSFHRPTTKLFSSFGESGSSGSINSGVELSAFTVAQLKDQLRSHGLPVSGRKADLVDRLSSLETIGSPSASVVTLPMRSVLITACKS
mmetsp:Transcript_19899/g.27026  ORF Transcript_19899/g.27026 Transcript_19899/m.27026 type:complete len:104 (-) Transcript_19899:41-352(-)